MLSAPSTKASSSRTTAPACAPVPDTADIDRAGEQGVKLAAAEEPAAMLLARFRQADGLHDAAPIQLVADSADRAEIEMELEYLPDEIGVVLDDGERAPVRLIAERRRTARPHAARHLQRIRILVGW